MTPNLEVQHYLLHFDALAIDDVANVNVRNRAAIIGDALRPQANNAGVNPKSHLIAALTPVGGPERAAILVLVAQMNSGHPVELGRLIEDNTDA